MDNLMKETKVVGGTATPEILEIEQIDRHRQCKFARASKSFYFSKIGLPFVRLMLRLEEVSLAWFTGG